MNPEIKTKWIVALRSGNYKQGTGYLRNKNRFCCLGVLCDIVDPEGWDGELHQQMSALPSQKIMMLACLDEVQSRRLATLNDCHGYSFEMIADYIEQNL